MWQFGDAWPNANSVPRSIVLVHVSSLFSTRYSTLSLNMQDDPTRDSLHPEAAFADYFRDSDAVADSAVAWQLESNSALLDAVRLLFQGSSALARLRLWALFTLVGQGKAFLSREGLDQLFHAMRPEVTDAVIKRLREANLLTWEDPSGNTQSLRWHSKWPACWQHWHSRRRTNLQVC